MKIDAETKAMEDPDDDDDQSVSDGDDQSSDSFSEQASDIDDDAPLVRVGTEYYRAGSSFASEPYRPHASAQRMCPLEVWFSQPKMRHLFGDGLRVADAVTPIRVVKCTEEEEKEHDAAYRLEAPFPTIEVIRWRCKLRDENTGRAKLDPVTGGELFDSEERWFSLDNRRLYCLQEAALRVWPERCVADVSEIRSGPHMRMPGIRKFRTPDLGRSILIGSRADGVPFVRWSWEDKTKGGKSMMVLEHLSSLKEGDYARIEMSKKLSWVLRRGAKSMRIPIDGEGWVRVNDLLKLKCLNCVNAEKFYEVVQESNKQKPRYQLKPSEGSEFELLIRASRKKAAIKFGTPNASPSGPPQVVSGAAPAPQNRLEGKGCGATGGRARGEGGGRQGKGKGSAKGGRAQAISKAPPASAVPKASSALTASLNAPAPREQAACKGMEPLRVASNLATDAAPADSGVPPRPPVRGPPPAPAAPARPLNDVDEVKPPRKEEKRGIGDFTPKKKLEVPKRNMFMPRPPLRGPRLPGNIPIPFQQMHAAQAVQAMQVQAMYNMMFQAQVHEMNQMQVAFATANLQAAAAAAARAASAVDTGIEAKIAEARAAASGAADIEAMIAEARGAAWERSIPNSSASSASAATDVVVRIAEARDAARGRGQHAAVETPSAAAELARSSARTHGQQDIEARIAEALEAARSRSNAGH